MNTPSKLLIALDQTLGFPNKIRSDVIKRRQWFDERSQEHVFDLEYRVKVQPGLQPPKADIRRVGDVNRYERVPAGVNRGPHRGSLPLIRELMDVKVIHKIEDKPIKAKQVKPKKPKAPKAPTVRQTIPIIPAEI